VSYRPQIELAGGEVVELPTTADTDFKLTPAQLDDAITPDTRLVVLNSPSNPCGTMYSEPELRALAGVIADAAADRAPHLVVVTDEIYEKLVFGGMHHFSLASVPEIAERTATINGLSKSYAMTGWRVGYLAGCGAFGERLANACKRLQSQLNTSIPAFILPAARAALTECADEVETMRRAFAERAAIMHDALSAIDGVVCPRPTGAFYCFCDVSAVFGGRSVGNADVRDARSFAEALLDEHHVAVVPGDDFGGTGPRCVRLTFATDPATIRDGVGRFADFIRGLR
jgi:aspartate aminotransferase